MDPLTMMLLYGLGTAAVQGGAALYKGPQERADEDEAEDLRRRLEMGTLGYTSADYTRDIEAQIAPTRALREQQADKAAAMRGTALMAGSGAALKEATIMDEAGAQLKREAAASAAGRSFKKAQAQEQRLYALEAGVAQSQQDRFEGVMTGVVTGLAAGTEYVDAKMLLEGAELSGEEMASFAKMTGLKDDEAKMLYKTMQSDPDVAAAYINLIAGQGSTSRPPIETYRRAPTDGMPLAIPYTGDEY